MSIKHAPGRIVVAVNHEEKNSHRFQNGTELALVRSVDNFNRRYTEPVNATVISAEKIEAGKKVLIHHNATQAMYRVYNYTALSGKEISEAIQYYAVPECDCYAIFDGEKWVPGYGYEFGLRVFIPYEGLIVGMPAKKIKDVLYVTTGNLSGKVVHTLKASDYEIVYQGTQGREERLIRFRHWDEEENSREEVICVNHDLTKRVKNGKLEVGLTSMDCKKISEYGTAKTV